MSDSCDRPGGYRDEELLSHIRRLADGDQPPTTEKFAQDADAPSAALVSRRFGSWNKGVETAGLEPRPRGGGKRYSDEEILDHIRRLSDDGPPTHREFKTDERAPSAWTAKDRFGSWNKAVEAAGFEPDPRGSGKRYSDEEILDHIRRLSEGNQPPAVEEFRSNAEAPNPETVIRRFGSWSEAVQTAGCDPISRGRHGIARDDLINWLLVWRCEFGVWPCTADLREWPGPSPDTYQRVFGGLPGAIKAAKEEMDDE